MVAEESAKSGNFRKGFLQTTQLAFAIPMLSALNRRSPLYQEAIEITVNLKRTLELYDGKVFEVALATYFQHDSSSKSDGLVMKCKFEA